MHEMAPEQGEIQGPGDKIRFMFLVQKIEVEKASRKIRLPQVMEILNQLFITPPPPPIRNYQRVI